jgi:CheY-like chemotaxis protein/anti-sigma regulatory factor (Ser/Thr protein kinase)
MDAGQFSMSVEPVAVASVLRDTYELASPLAVRQGVQLELVDEHVAASYVLADRQRLRQVLINLISNAIKYNRPGGSASILVAKLPGDRIAIEIMDSGPGISPSDLERLFVPFERLDAANSGVEGTGLGLVLSRDLIENMGGALEVSSVVGVGSTFSVVLNAVEPTVVDTASPMLQGVVETRTYPGGERRLLYVEDLVANVALVEEILKRRPAVSLIPAMFGGIAIELARQHQPDLVLLDLHLPDVRGDEVLRRLKEDPATRSIPVVMLSADATERQRERLLSAGASAYLTKPIGVQALLESVDQFLGS